MQILITNVPTEGQLPHTGNRWFRRARPAGAPRSPLKRLRYAQFLRDGTEGAVLHDWFWILRIDMFRQ